MNGSKSSKLMFGVHKPNLNIFHFSAHNSITNSKLEKVGIYTEKCQL